ATIPRARLFLEFEKPSPLGSEIVTLSRAAAPVSAVSVNDSVARPLPTPVSPARDTPAVLEPCAPPAPRVTPPRGAGFGAQRERQRRPPIANACKPGARHARRAGAVCPACPARDPAEQRGTA